MNKKQLMILLVIVVFVLTGCITSEGLKKLPEEKLRYSAGFYAANTYRQEIASRHPEWDENIKQNILKGKVSIGMTGQQVRASWGDPYKINRTVTKSGSHEQWIYGVYKAIYLYFDNGILTSFQD